MNESSLFRPLQFYNKTGLTPILKAENQIVDNLCPAQVLQLTMVINVLEANGRCRLNSVIILIRVQALLARKCFSKLVAPPVPLLPNLTETESF